MKNILIKQKIENSKTKFLLVLNVILFSLNLSAQTNEANLAKYWYYRHEKGIVENDVMRSELNDFDSLSFTKDTLIKDIKEFDNQGKVDRKDLLAYFYAQRGDFAFTDSILNVMSSNTEDEMKAKMIEVYKALKQNGKNLDYIVNDPALKQKVLDAVNDSTRDGYIFALNILQRLFGKEYYEPIEDVEVMENRHLTITKTEDQKDANSFISCYPNPTASNTSFKYILPAGCEQGIIDVYNSIGQKVHSFSINKNSGIEVYNLTNQNNGLYFYTLKVNGNTIAKDKFVINK